MDVCHSNKFMLCVHAVWRTARRQIRFFRLWRKPCRVHPFPIRERGYSVARRRAPSVGSLWTTWMTASNRSVCAHLHLQVRPLLDVVFCASVIALLLCFDFNAFMSALQGLETTGALDLGGASTQISFVSDNFDGSESPSNSVTFRLYGNDYNLYTHSFLCYGKDQALRSVVAHQTQVDVWFSSSVNTNGLLKSNLRYSET